MGERLEPELARRVGLVVLDVDGVLTDNGVYIGQTASGEAVELKRFGITDGLGIRMLEWSEIPVVLISGRESEATTIRAGELGVECHQDGGARKLPALRDVMRRHGVGWDEVAFVGDDLADLPALMRVGLPVAVANAVPEVKAVARLHLRRPGGHGAVREFVETLLRARGEWSRRVEEYVTARGELDEDDEG